MTRRALLAAVLSLIAPRNVAADIAGTRRQRRADERCRRAGRVRERHGLTDRERAQLARMRCRKVGDEWLSAEYFQA